MDYSKYLYVENEKQLKKSMEGVQETNFEEVPEHNKFDDFVLDYHKDY